MSDNRNSNKKCILYGLKPEEYEHPLDRQALNALEGTPGLETIIRKINQYGIEKIYRAQHTGSNIRVTSTNIPEVYRIFLDVCQTINLKTLPELYIQQGEDINAFAIGSENPIVVLNQGTVRKYTEKELAWVIGHEIGHIKSQHTVYRMLAEQIFPYLGDILGKVTLGIGELFSTPILIALKNWSRKSELTCDRAGLLAVQDFDVAVTALMKMAGAPETHYSKLDPQQFLTQARAFEAYDEDNLDKIAKLISVMDSTHPWTVMRCAELDSWCQSGAYKQMVETHCNPVTTTAFCKHCGKSTKPGAKFCIHCGNSM